MSDKLKKIDIEKHRAKRHKNRTFWVVSLVVSVAVFSFLILSAFNDSIVFYYSPNDIATKQIKNKEYFRIGGLVKDSSIRKQGEKTFFIITDGKSEVFVIYKGLLPSLFKEGQGVVAEGEFNQDSQPSDLELMGEENFTNFQSADSPNLAKKIMRAKIILAKHDENYMPKEVVDALKQSGEWKRD